MSLITSALGKRKRKKENTAFSLTIDYPQEGEHVTSKNYTFRIGAGANLQQVEVSINGGSWLPCRATSGYWWYDWRGYQSGSQILLARGFTDTGEDVISPRRQFIT